MLGLQGSGPPSSKIYRCVACSATFSGLAALLVHQATHANMLPKVIAPPSTQPDMSLQGALAATLKSSNPPASSDGASPSFYICDCGEEFQDFCLMLDHKQSHNSPLKSPPTTNSNAVSSETVPGAGSPNLTAESTVAVTDSVQSCPTTSGSPPVKIEPKACERLEESKVVPSTHLEQCQPAQEIKDGQLDQTSSSTEPISQTVRDSPPAHSSDDEEPVVKNNKLMKIIATAYMKHVSASPPPNDSHDLITPKQEAIPVDITPVQESEELPINDLSVAKYRRLLAKTSVKTKAPTISRIIDSSTKKIVSLTKMLSPVVVLETRQKLRDSSSNALFGKYQCGRCRRTFANADRLTEHHFLHKKERIKCCRRCKQLIIGKLPFTDNHVCVSSVKKPAQEPSTSPLVPRIVPFHNMKKSFFCPVCKHNYARRYNLKKHKCHGPRAALSQTHPSADRLQALRSSNKASAFRDGQGERGTSSVSVCTEAPRVKVEVTSTTSEQSEISDWSGFTKGFPPFLSPPMDQHKDASASVMENSSSDALPKHNESSNDGQWTMPLDDEMELLGSSRNAGNEDEMELESEIANLRYFVRDGVKRYPCPRCQKTYSRPSTLARHLRLCGFRPRGAAPVSHSANYGGGVQNSITKQMFPCSVCGRNFNRKDNMMVHKRRCQLQRAATREPLQQHLPAGAKGSPDNDANNWGIMSLPSVLPRRVTCECGFGFTSPRLLLEHLQKHAQESYTCPTCGETVNSWADYEVHLQIHMHPHHQLRKGLQAQRSQPLVLRIQQQPPQQPQQPQPPPPLPVRQPSPKEPVPERSNVNKKQRVICTRCGNTFATRCSLRRHLSWDRCKGGRPQNTPKSYRCSRCSSEFPNMVSLLFHQRSGACKPPIKPVRCPVCLRWFGTVDGLQKHLLTHKQSETHRCDICQCSYPSLKSLKTHRKRVHNVMCAELMT
ncbi:zinc finger protein 1035 isoform X3 [Hippocampus comes]|uniref:zinc finger protein 1035 isoform X3 n=1 Tax=Hippocampus comes TaxID=109280 RepID=UPI00094E32E9|nr:PREDICTED: zinc finger protein Xfin-like isoform X3 [Hippocampus comes]XP_019741728.1 PREDICTED: zinc finger protein Xfin-like isoform X3 [Hippocampus comes]XP_019741729.1 PREDICTED: zinc finger protein Xfin-like isoform X3 [Hippocampus comes]XP_019741730.1 PREDICTED: zinc finger protein Xfin-like isoform X3 [Hippocampus comes]XP_019741731.1 PREDICTED: zinc finger protein Xfin-like isoform X3 [Hippocampus comes]